MKQNKFKLEIYMKRGFHPYMSATYINGYVKDQSLRNYEEEEVMDQFKKLWNSLGRKPLKHNTLEVSKEITSIQGKWTDDLWSKYPKHEMEIKAPPPEFKGMEEPSRKQKKFRIRLHDTTRILRYKPAIESHGLQH